MHEMFLELSSVSPEAFIKFIDKIIVLPFSKSSVANAKRRKDIVPDLYLNPLICLKDKDTSDFFWATSFETCSSSLYSLLSLFSGEIIVDSFLSLSFSGLGTTGVSCLLVSFSEVGLTGGITGVSG